MSIKVVITDEKEEVLFSKEVYSAELQEVIIKTENEEIFYKTETKRKKVMKKNLFDMY